MIIFLVSGFWHGANWTFVCWGLFHALLFFPLLFTGKNRKYTDVIAKDKLLPSVKECFQMLGTFFLAVIGWIIFRAETIHQAWDYMVCMITKFQFAMPMYGKKALVYIFILLLVEWIQREKQHGLQLDECKGVLKHRVVRWGMYIFLALVILSLSGVQAEFIYFQF